LHNLLSLAVELKLGRRDEGTVAYAALVFSVGTLLTALIGSRIAEQRRQQKWWRVSMGFLLAAIVSGIGAAAL